MPKLNIDQKDILDAKSIASHIVEDIHKRYINYSSVSIERTVLRLLGVDGANEDGNPWVNTIITKATEAGMLELGIFAPFVSLMKEHKCEANELAKKIVNDEVTFKPIKKDQTFFDKIANRSIAVLEKTAKSKKAKKEKYKDPSYPQKYLIVATGNIYEDRTQAESAVYCGADIIAVIRSTAQSLLDFVPHGATTEGYGGTYATQENFRIMREKLDELCEKHGRYIKLVNYSSGLCMAEIAAAAAIEDLDMLLNDSMYGILFRDINMKRTFIDQHFSRLICAKSDIIINTGEDNYLTTSDAMENAHTVTASQLINEAMAKKAGLKEELMGLGHAYEINPKVENALLYELAHASLARTIFPKAPLKYMPPTKYKSTDIYFSHVMDTMFNFVSVSTDQGIHLSGMPTEAIHTPHMHDRSQALDSINYVFNIAKDLSSEIEFKSDGIIQKRATQVLKEATELLQMTKKEGLTEVIAKGIFGDIKRTEEGGKGLEGVFLKSKDYCNPIWDKLEEELCNGK